MSFLLKLTAIDTFQSINKIGKGTETCPPSAVTISVSLDGLGVYLRLIIPMFSNVTGGDVANA